MVIPNSSLLWIAANIFPSDEADLLFVKDAYSQYCEDVSDHSVCSMGLFVKSLHALFPNHTVSRRKRYGARETALVNLTYIPNNSNVSYVSVSNESFECPYGYLCSKNEPNSVSIMRSSEYVINSTHRLFKMIHFSEKTWSLSVGESQIDLNKFGIDTTFEWTQQKINTVAKVVDTFKLCTGRKQDSSCASNKIIEEYVTGNSNSCNVRTFRSKYCLKIVLPTALSETCVTCLKYVPKYKNDDTCEIVHDTSIYIDDQESQDFEDVAKKAMEDNSLPKPMKNFIECQLKNVSKSSKGRRWDSNFISFCLSIYQRSPKVYEQLQSGGMFILPSGRLLQYYKNSVDQNPDFTDDILIWMKREADRINVPDEGRHGGLLLDEMSLQEDLGLKKCASSFVLVGQKDLGPECSLIDIISKESCHLTCAKYVLQFIFVGYTGFRFPVCHFPTTGASAHEIYINFWKGVDKMSEYGFHIDYSSLDGAITNRQFVKMHFHSDSEAIKNQFCAISPVHPNKSVVMIQDIKHNIKKIRNGILKSSKEEKGTRLLKVEGKIITWSHWWKIYHWDKCHPLPLHRKLTNEHLSLSNTSKMRNKLAEDVLSAEMLNAFKHYKQSHGSTTDIDGPIKLLEHTSVLVKFANDFRPIADIHDKRLEELKVVLNFFNQWEEKAGSPKDLLSKECMFDVKSYLHGFLSLSEKVLKRKCLAPIVPGRLNSDLVENVFCQMRGIKNGLNRNPTYKQYGPACTGITLGQTLLSKKCNAGSSEKENASPFTKPGPLKRKQNTVKPHDIKLKLLRL